MRRLPVILLLACTGALRAQGGEEHPFLASFTVVPQEGRVLVEWVMRGGSTCDGAAVERSANGGPFAVVHRIEGLCGDPAVEVPFAWVDADPPELSELRYRIVFADQGRSSEKGVRFQQLTRSDLRIYPTPTAGAATLLVRASAAARVHLRVLDAAGRLVLEQPGLTGREHAIDLSGQAAGVYQVVALVDGRRLEGRVVKQ